MRGFETYSPVAWLEDIFAVQLRSVRAVAGPRRTAGRWSASSRAALAVGAALAVSAPVALSELVSRTAVTHLGVPRTYDPLVAPPGYVERVALALRKAPRLEAPELANDPDFAF